MPLSDLLRDHVPPLDRHRWQTWLADACGVKRQAVAYWCDVGRVPAKRIESVCAALANPPGLRDALVARVVGAA